VAVRLDWAVPARYAEASADGTATIIGAGLDSVWPQDVPTDIGLFLMVRIVGPRDEFEEEHQLEIRLVTPDREEQAVLTADFQSPPSGRSPFAVPGLEPGLLIPAGIAFSAEDYGSTRSRSTWTASACGRCL
jgi:hypothetical protein